MFLILEAAYETHRRIAARLVRHIVARDKAMQNIPLTAPLYPQSESPP